MLNLSEWAGKKARLSLVTRVVPSYENIGGREVVTPNKIAADWYMFELVSSDFWVELGAPERVSSWRINGKTIRHAHSKIASATIHDVSVFEQVLKQTDYYAQLIAPIDTPICSTFIPEADGYPGRHVGYFSSTLTAGNDPFEGHHNDDSPEKQYGGSTRMFDFCGTDKNLYSASVEEVTAAILIHNGTAVAVLSPSGDASRDFDDHYAGISSVACDTLSNGTKVIHSFFHAEDHFDEDLGTVDDHANPKYKTYARIGYARSTVDDHDFGREFTAIHHNAAYPIIEYVTDETLWNNFNIPQIWGCGQPSVIPYEDYYYLYYTTWGIKDTIHAPISLICVARAPKSSVNDTNYSGENNPWKIFREKDPDNWENSDNWLEDGLGGEYSGLYNVEIQSASYGIETVDVRTDRGDDRHKWRYAPMVSYNEYLEKSIIICDGGLGASGSHGIVIHSSTDPVSWDDGLMIVISRDILKEVSEDYGYAKYVSLMGSGGEDRWTTEYNKMYYRWSDDDLDLRGAWRSDLRFIKY